MSERCQRCGILYETIYRVPNDVWAKITPNSNQFGGLLCVPCADSLARIAGITLYWDSNAGDWRENEVTAGAANFNLVALKAAAELQRQATEGPWSYSSYGDKCYAYWLGYAETKDSPYEVLEGHFEWDKGVTVEDVAVCEQQSGEKDFAFCAAARNLPLTAIVAEIEAKDAEIERLREENKKLKYPSRLPKTTEKNLRKGYPA